MTPYHTIWTHRRLDLDAACAAWLLKNFGEDEYPGISQAEIKFVENQEELEEKGLENAIPVDIGRGEFDHHQGSDSECAATLVAKKLGVAQKDELKDILEFVKTTDLEGAHNRFDVSYLTKAVSNYLEPLQAIHFAFSALTAEYRRQKKYLEAVKEIKEAEVEMMIPVGKKKIKLVGVHSENKEIAKAASHVLKADMIVKKEPTGNVQILTYRNGRSLNLDRLVRAIRYKEFLSEGREEKPQLEKITRDDQLTGKWYYWQGNGILNGSDTANIEPTNLTIDQIVTLVKKFLDKSKLPRSCPANPEEGEYSCKLSDCSWYEVHFPKCQKIRNAIN